MYFKNNMRACVDRSIWMKETSQTGSFQRAVTIQDLILRRPLFVKNTVKVVKLWHTNIKNTLPDQRAYLCHLENTLELSAFTCHWGILVDFILAVIVFCLLTGERNCVILTSALEILMSTMKTRICLTNAEGVEEFACLLHSSDELFHKTVEEKQQRTKKKKHFGIGGGCWGLPGRTGTKLVDGPSCRTQRSNALWAAARFSGIIQAFLGGSLYLITCDRAAPCVGIQPLRSSGVMKENWWHCSLYILIFRWDELWQYLCAKISRAPVFCHPCWVFVSLSTSTDDGLSLTKRCPVLCNPWIRDVWAWFLKWILYVEQLLWSAPCAPVYTEATTHTATSFHDWSQLCRCTVKCSTPCSRITCHFLVHSN